MLLYTKLLWLSLSLIEISLGLIGDVDDCDIVNCTNNKNAVDSFRRDFASVCCIRSSKIFHFALLASLLSNIFPRSSMTDEGSNKDDYSSTTAEENQTMNKEEPSRETSLGNFFRYAAVALVSANVIIGILLTAVRLASYGWSRLPVGTLLGLKEEKDEPRNISIILDIHAFVAVAAVFLALFQAVSLFSFSKDRYRVFHRWNGRFLFFLWMFCTCSGYVYSITSSTVGEFAEDPRMERRAYMSFFWWGGIGIIINGVIGYRAIAHNPDEEKNYLLHKSSMFFFLFWGLGSGIVVLMIAILQLFLQDCLIDDFVSVLCHLVGLGGQFLAILLSIRRYDPALLKCTNVRMNLIALFLFVGYFVVLTIIAAILPSDNEAVCF